jgi:hypothetical protein
MKFVSKFKKNKNYDDDYGFSREFSNLNSNEVKKTKSRSKVKAWTRPTEVDYEDEYDNTSRSN